MNINSPLYTYLAGQINHKNPEAFEYAKKWRLDIAEKLLKFEIKSLDPLGQHGGDTITPQIRTMLRLSYAEKNDDAVRFIVDGIINKDLELLLRSNFVTLHLPKDDGYETCGTYGEATLAKYIGIPVYIVTDREINQIPEWLIGCSTKIFKSWDEYLKYIESRYVKVFITEYVFD